LGWSSRPEKPLAEHLADPRHALDELLALHDLEHLVRAAQLAGWAE